MSTVDEIRGRVQVSGDIGEKLDGVKEASEMKAQQLEGASVAFKTAQKAIALLHASVDKDMEESEGEAKLFPSGGSDLEIASYVKRYITRASECCGNLAEKAKADMIAASGRASALKEAVEIVQKYHNASLTRANQIRAAMEAASTGEVIEESEEEAQARRKARAPGEHPGPSPHDARRAAAAEAQKG
jgi:hypothetical protein